MPASVGRLAATAPLVEHRATLMGPVGAARRQSKWTARCA